MIESEYVRVNPDDGTCAICYKHRLIVHIAYVTKDIETQVQICESCLKKILALFDD